MNDIHFLSSCNLSARSGKFLKIGVWSLAVAGIFSLVLVIARTPGFCDVPYFMKLFHEALVVHVDLSVLVWFLAIACMFWNILTENLPSTIPYIRRASQFCFITGMCLIAASPFDPKGEAMMSNYIPVIMSPLFFLGLSLILSGAALMLTNLFFHTAKIFNNPIFSKAICFGIFTAAIIGLFSIFAFVWSFVLMPKEIDGQQYYELGFWGGGHVLQFVHTQILLICWLWLATKLKADFYISNKLLYSLFSIGLLSALTTPIPYFLYHVTDSGYRAFFTYSMISLGGIAPAILSLFIIPVLWKKRDSRKGQNKALWSSLSMSVVLFLYGGILAMMIEGQNVVIPAHYHGSIVGVTLAFMGIAYLLLPYFGFKDISANKLAFWQPIIYGFGQIMHISGLAYSGGYGNIQRKTPCGGGVELAPDIKIAMGMMGGGGLFAIIGGLIFVLIVLKSCRQKIS